MQWISCFKNEKEILLFNQVIPIQSTKNFEQDSAALMEHFLNTLKQRETEIVDKAKFYKELGFEFDESWMMDIIRRRLLFANTSYPNKTVLERLVEELKIEDPWQSQYVINDIHKVRGGVRPPTAESLRAQTGTVWQSVLSRHSVQDSRWRVCL